MGAGRGLVVGKFFPPHKGHIYLIKEAKKGCDHLTVLVVDAKNESIPASLRAKWIRELVSDVEVLVVEDIYAYDDSRAWAKYTIKILGYSPDVVFTSEDYGDPFAQYMGCKHVLIDKERIHVPISGTKVRSNPLKYWDYIDEPVRAYFAKRVCVVGAESTGTTTIAKALANYYKTVWVPEFGRFYSEGKMQGPVMADWGTKEFIYIAKMQNSIEHQLAKICNKILICDTDSFATSIWHERYIGYMSEDVDLLSKDRKYDLYFLTDVDIPFVQDGLRDGEHIRDNMHKKFIEELTKRGKKFIILSGSHEKRLATAIKHCNQLL